MKLGRLISSLKAIQSSEDYKTFPENIQHNIAELLSIIVRPATEPETLMQEIRRLVTQLNNDSKDVKEKEPSLLPLLKSLSTDTELSELQQDISREAQNFSVHIIDYWRNEIQEAEKSNHSLLDKKIQEAKKALDDWLKSKDFVIQNGKLLDANQQEAKVTNADNIVKFNNYVSEHMAYVRLLANVNQEKIIEELKKQVKLEFEKLSKNQELELALLGGIKNILNDDTLSVTRRLNLFIGWINTNKNFSTLSDKFSELLSTDNFERQKRESIAVEIPLDLSNIKNYQDIACIEDETFFKYCSQNNLDELPSKILTFFIQSFHERIEKHKKECLKNIPIILNQLKKTLDESQDSAAEKIDDLDYLFKQMGSAESTIELDIYLAQSKKIIYDLSVEMPGTNNLNTLLTNFNKYGDICSALVGTETERNISIFAKILKKIGVLITHVPGVHEVFAVAAVVSEAGPSPFIHFKPKPPPFRERARDFLKKHWKGILFSILLSTLLIAAVAFPYIAPAFLAGAALATAITVSGYVTFGLGAVSVGSVAWSLGSLWKKEKSRHNRIETRLANFKERFIASGNQKPIHESESEIFSHLQHAEVIKLFNEIVNNEILKDKHLTNAQRDKISIEVKKIYEKITPEGFSQLNSNIQKILLEGSNPQVFEAVIQKLQDLDRKFQSEVLVKNIAASPATVQTTHPNEPEKSPVNVNEKTAKEASSSEPEHPHL